MRKYLAAALLAACTAAHAGLILSESVYPGWYYDLLALMPTFTPGL